jgi:hypothetical protein
MDGGGRGIDGRNHACMHKRILAYPSPSPVNAWACHSFPSPRLLLKPCSFHAIILGSGNHHDLPCRPREKCCCYLTCMLPGS